MRGQWRTGRSAVVGIACVGVAAALAGAVAAATAAKPHNVTRPAVSGAGNPVQGQALHADRGRWSGNPTDFNVYWQRCARSGGNCGKIGGTDGAYAYVPVAADVGYTLRFRVGAKNGDGRTWASSWPTAIVAGAQAPPRPAPTGCPAATNPTPVSGISLPARLTVDRFEAVPGVVTRSTGALILRFHVVSSCGGPVQGALLYATATPYDQFTVPSEQPTGADGWGELRLNRLGGFPVNDRQKLVVVFVRARKPGGELLGGVSTRRLVSVRVDLGR